MKNSDLVNDLKCWARLSTKNDLLSFESCSVESLGPQWDAHESTRQSAAWMRIEQTGVASEFKGKLGLSNVQLCLGI